MLAFRPEATAQPARPGSIAGTTSAAANAAAGKNANAGANPSTAAGANASTAAGTTPSASEGTTLSAAAGPLVEAVRLTSIDAANWPAVVEAAGLSGMVRQLALNCVPAGFEHNLLTLKLDQAASDRRTRPMEEKLVQGLSKYLGSDIRLAFETAEADLNSPARQRVQAEQERVARAASAFESDPAVKGLRERFGADVDVASVKPSN
jgi:DNA polymerase III tau subunit V interacting with alpha